MVKQRELSLTQKRFVEEYMLDRNAKNAAIRSGYSPKAATNSGPRLLKNALVSARIDEKIAALSTRTGVTKERIIQELARIAFVNVSNLIDEEGFLKPNASIEDMAAISSIKFKTVAGKNKCEVKLADKNKALAILGKHYGIFTEEQVNSKFCGVTIIDNIPRYRDEDRPRPIK